MERYKDMISFKDIDYLCDYIMEKSEEEFTSVIANRDIILTIMYDLISAYCDIEIGCCHIDFEDMYDKEYYLSIFKNEDTDIYSISIEKAYNEDTQCYLGTDGYIMFHEETNSKALRDILNNHNSEVSDYDWFIIGEDDVDESIEHDDNVKNKNTNKINDKVNNKNDKVSDKVKTEKTDVKYSKDDNGNIHGFILSSSDGNGYRSYSYYGTDVLDGDELKSLVRAMNESLYGDLLY